jgi:hypothetical protein
MIRNMVLTAIAAVVCLDASISSAQNTETGLPSDMFSQYATAKAPGEISAGIYSAVRHSHAPAAQSYCTYQPCMPHELVYTHSRTYFNYGGTNHAFTLIH